MYFPHIHVDDTNFNNSCIGGLILIVVTPIFVLSLGLYSVRVDHKFFSFLSLIPFFVKNIKI